MRKLPIARGIQRELYCGTSLSAFFDDVTVMVSSHEHIELVGETLKQYEVVTGATIIREMTVDLRFGTSRSKDMSSSCASVVRYVTDGSVNMFGEWFGHDPQTEKNRDDITCRVACLANQ